MTWLGCGCHSLDLALEDIGKTELATYAISMGNRIVKFIRRYQWVHALYRQHSRAPNGCGKEVLKPGVFSCSRSHPTQLHEKAC